MSRAREWPVPTRSLKCGAGAGFSPSVDNEDQNGRSCDCPWPDEMPDSGRDAEGPWRRGAWLMPAWATLCASLRPISQPMARRPSDARAKEAATRRAPGSGPASNGASRRLRRSPAPKAGSSGSALGGTAAISGAGNAITAPRADSAEDARPVAGSGAGRDGFRRMPEIGDTTRMGGEIPGPA